MTKGYYPNGMDYTLPPEFSTFTLFVCTSNKIRKQHPTVRLFMHKPINIHMSGSDVGVANRLRMRICVMCETYVRSISSESKHFDFSLWKQSGNRRRRGKKKTTENAKQI